MLDKASLGEQNPWWKEAALIDSDEHVATALASRPQKLYSFIDDNLLILGPRQVGKTTFMKLAIRDLLANKKVSSRNVLYFSCDSLSSKEDILSLASYFNEVSAGDGIRYLFLDEITFVKDWNVALLALFNSGYLKGKRIYVTGSSSLALQKETLPGRNIKKMPFYPLSFADYFDLLSSARIKRHAVDLADIRGVHKAALGLTPHLTELNRHLENYLRHSGGYLSGIYEFLSKNADPFDRLYEVYRDAVLSDMAKVGRSPQTLKEVSYGIILNYASRFSALSIARNTSIKSHKTVEEYMNLMEGLFMIKVLRKKADGRIMYRSNKKAYFIDPFLYRVMKFYSSGKKEISDEEMPRIAEGAVGSLLLRKREDVYYWAASSGREVDFTYKDIGIEVKYGNAAFSDLNCGRGYVVSRENELKLDSEGKKLILPLSAFLYIIS